MLTEENNGVIPTRVIECREINLVVVVVSVARTSTAEGRSQKDLPFTLCVRESLLELSSHFFSTTFTKETVDSWQARSKNGFSLNTERFTVDVSQVLGSTDRVRIETVSITQVRRTILSKSAVTD